MGAGGFVLLGGQSSSRERAHREPEHRAAAIPATGQGSETNSELCPFITNFMNCANASITIRPTELKNKKDAK